MSIVHHDFAHSSELAVILFSSETPTGPLKAPLAHLSDEEEEEGEEGTSVMGDSAVKAMAPTTATVHTAPTPLPRSSTPLSHRKCQGLESDAEMYYGQVEDSCYFTSELDSD